MPGESRRVVVTGRGAISALGATPVAIARRLLAGESGIRPISRFDPSRHKSRLAAEVDEAGLALKPSPFAFESARMASFVRFALHAGEAALAESGLALDRVSPDRGRIALGVAMGGLPNIEAGVHRQDRRGPAKTSPFLIPSLIPNMAAGMLALRLGFRGAQQTFAGACAAGTQAIAESFAALRRGEIDWALCGGAEAVTTPIAFSGFEAMRALSLGQDPGETPRPFDRRRDGFIVGEGAALYTIEALEPALARGAMIYGEILGAACTTGAEDLTVASPEGIRRCMARAIADAGLDPGAIDSIFAQGSGMVRGDAAELAAIAALFAPPPPVTSIKACTGYAFAANGPLNLLAALAALESRRLPGTGNFTAADPEHAGIDIVAATRPFGGRHCLVNAQGFGGVNASLVIGAAP